MGLGRRLLLALLPLATLAFQSPAQFVTAAQPRGFAIMGRKPGVSSPEELAAFVQGAGEKLIVVDVRNPDFEKEPGDGATNEKAPIGDAARKAAVNVVYDRSTDSMDLSKIPAARLEAGGGKERVPVITHCGGGGRGEKAKQYLLANGFKNVLNGGGPEDDECWATFGAK